jgi:4-amino-4-deoxy-L-arabinose transferase-like glycosyltransferase
MEHLLKDTEHISLRENNMRLRLSFFWLSFICILLVAAVLRLYQLGQVPHGMTWDEAAIGYNGFSVITVRRDQWLHFLPISFQSFGDYKAPLAIYITGVFTVLFGLNLWAIRLPFALAGIVGVAGFMLFLRELFTQEKKSVNYSAEWLSLVGGAFLTVSPWYLHFTRTAFESGMALMWLVWGFYFFFLILKDQSNKFDIKKFALIAATAGSFAFGLYTYHSVKVVLPLLGLVFLIMYWKKIWQNWKSFFFVAVIAGALLFPLYNDTVHGKGGERFTQVSFVEPGMTTVQILNKFDSNFLSHFTPNFLFLGETTSLRHGDGKWGVLFPTTFLMILSSLVFAGVHARKKVKPEYLRIFLLGAVWVIVGVLPAAIGRDVPHSNRALLALPGFLLLAVLGLDSLLKYLSTSLLNCTVSGSKGEDNLLVKSVLGVFILFHVFFVMSYLQHYYTDFAHESSADYADGYLEAFKYVWEQEPQVDKIVVTNSYSQPYIYALIAGKVNPIQFNNGALIKFEFKDKIEAGELLRQNAMIVATPEEVDPRIGTHLIYGSDGKVRFVIVKTP